MRVTTVMAAAAVVLAWGCVLPLLHASTAHAQGVSFRVQDLLAGDSSDLLRSGSSVASPCVTQDGQQGVCGSATTCPTYLPLLPHLRNHTVLAFFRTRVCRHSPGSIHVCCPVQSPVFTTPKSQSSSIFLLGPGQETQSARGGSLRPSQRPNTRQPAGAGPLSDDNKDEVVNREFLNLPTFPSQPPPPPSPPPRLRPTFRTTLAPHIVPPVLATTRRLTTLSPSTGILLSPDREPTASGSPTPSSPALQGHDQAPTEPAVSSILPVEGECGATTQGKTPWAVSLGVLARDEFRITCGGALITRLHVIAAAHCLQDQATSHVRLGDHGSREHLVDVPLRSGLNAAYNAATRANNLALLTLATPVTFTDNIRPVCLPLPYRLDGFRGQELQVVGWGSRSNLEVGKVEILGLDQCRAVYRSPSLISSEVTLFSRPSSSFSSSSSSSSAFINPRTSVSVTVNRQHLCGSPAPSSSSTSCLSDHGAPLYFHDEETTGLYFLAGVSSLGDGCQAGPGLYTRVGAFIPWLSRQLSGVEVLARSPTFSSPSTRTLQHINRNRG